MIRLIASDIDGTLVPDSSDHIDPVYYDLIRDLKDMGVYFCVCSGRQYHSMMKLFSPVAEHIFCITENGTLIRSRDRIIHRWAVDPAHYVPLLQEIRMIEGASAVVSYPEMSYVESGEDSTVFRFLHDSYRYQIKNVPDLLALPHEDVLKLTIHCENCEEKCRSLLESHWAEEVNMTCSGVQWIDICSRDSGKGEALARLQNYLGVSKEETMYFGDNMNDLPAFEKAGITATVANARAEVRERADIVGKSYNELGVLKVIKNVLELD